MNRIVVMVASLGLILGVTATSSAEPSGRRPEPARSGTIAGGTGVIFHGNQPAGERWGCEYSADCLAWLQSGCDPALAGHDLAPSASIVDVGVLADGRTRRSFQWVSPSRVHPGAVVQFWREDCTELPEEERHTWNPYTNSCGTCDPFVIRRGTRWMTVSANWTTAVFVWTLT